MIPACTLLYQVFLQTDTTCVLLENFPFFPYCLLLYHMICATVCRNFVWKRTTYLAFWPEFFLPGKIVLEEKEEETCGRSVTPDSFYICTYTPSYRHIRFWLVGFGVVPSRSPGRYRLVPLQSLLLPSYHCTIRNLNLTYPPHPMPLLLLGRTLTATFPTPFC